MILHLQAAQKSWIGSGTLKNRAYRSLHEWR